MKRHNLLGFTAWALCSLFVVNLFSCKSTPDLAPVDPIELLDGNAALYLSVPVQANSDFVEAAVQKVAGVTEADAKRIVERLDDAFVSISPNGEIQLSANGKIPTSFLGFALNEKKGWNESVIEQQLCYTHQFSKYQLCLPSSSNAFLSRDIAPMVRRFNKVSLSIPSEAEKLLSETLPEKPYQFLHDIKSSDILVYSPYPKALVRSFIGSEVNTPVSSIYAVFSQYRGVKEQFNVKLILNLSDPRTTKACAALIKTALFGVPASVFQTGPQQITIADLPLPQKQILSMFW